MGTIPHAAEDSVANNPGAEGTRSGVSFEAPSCQIRLRISGKLVDIFDLQPEDIHVFDIAYGLSGINRYLGQSRITVAEHSWVMSLYAEKHWGLDAAREALMHDATEAYFGDIVWSLKEAVPILRQLEALVWAPIAKKFGLPIQMSPEIRSLDRADALTEIDYLFPGHPVKGDKANLFVLEMTPEKASAKFIDRYNELFK